MDASNKNFTIKDIPSTYHVSSFVLQITTWKQTIILRHTLWHTITLYYRKWQKFRGWKVSRFAEFIRYAGKSFAIFPSPPSYIHDLHTFMVFQLYKTATSVSTKDSCSSREFLLKLSLAYSEMDESTLNMIGVFTDTYVCRFHAFQDNHAVTGGEELQLKWVWDETGY